jgi:hypothetical protein
MQLSAFQMTVRELPTWNGSWNHTYPIPISFLFFLYFIKRFVKTNSTCGSQAEPISNLRPKCAVDTGGWRRALRLAFSESHLLTRPSIRASCVTWVYGNITSIYVIHAI